MLKILVNILGWVPVLGVALKIAYVSQRASEVVKGIKVSSEDAELKGEELDKHLSDVAQEGYDEFLKPEVDSLGLPEIATDKASEKAIAILTQKLKEKYVSKTSA